ncbi:MAG: Chemotaxis protein CheW, partial [bacterium]
FNSKPMWGILVDRVSRVFDIGRENLFALPNIIENSSVSAFQGVVKVKGEMLLYLAPQYLHPQSPSKQALDKQTNFNWEVLIKQINRGQYRGQVLVFSTGNHQIKNKNILLGLSITQVLQVLKSATIAPIPMSPEYILGFINWQNLPIPVVDLNLYLGLGSSLISNPDSRLLIARAATAQAIVAIAIEPLVKTLNLPIENKPIELPFLTDKAFSIKSFELRDEILVILDIDGIIDITTSLSNI